MFEVVGMVVIVDVDSCEPQCVHEGSRRVDSLAELLLNSGEYE